MIESKELTCGPTPDATPIKWTESPGVTIFVGPNNSGKSALLQEISESFTSERRSNRSALKRLKFSAFSQEIFDDYSAFKGMKNSETVTLGNQETNKGNWFKMFSTSWDKEGQRFRRSRFFWMGGSKRLHMLQQERNANLLSPEGPLARLYVNDAERAVFHNAVFSGIKIYPVIDNLTSYGTFELAFSREKPNPANECSTGDGQRAFLKKSLREREVSDGCRAYTGILGALYSGP